MEIRFNPPFFTAYLQPLGFLTEDYATHALWNYYLCARRAYEIHELDPLKLEGEWEVHPRYLQIFTSIARMYEVKPEEMAKCWDLIDAQCNSLKLPKLPNEERYRFNRIAVIH